MMAVRTGSCQKRLLDVESLRAAGLISELLKPKFPGGLEPKAAVLAVRQGCASGGVVSGGVACR